MEHLQKTDRTNVRYRGVNFIVEVAQEECHQFDNCKQYWAKIEWREPIAGKFEEIAELTDIPDYRFEFFTSYTGRGRHRSIGDVFEEASAYAKETIDIIFDYAVEHARLRADRAEVILNSIKEGLTQRQWAKSDV